MKDEVLRSLNSILVAERSKNATKKTETCRENDVKMDLKGMCHCFSAAKNTHVGTGGPFMIR